MAFFISNPLSALGSDDQPENR